MAQQWTPTLRCPEGGASAPEAPGNPDSGVHAGDGGNKAEVPSSPAELATGPAWILSESWVGPAKHYSQRAHKGQQSNVKFGKAREDIEAYAQGVEPFEDINDETFRVPFHDMTNFVQTMVQLCCAPGACFKLVTHGIAFCKGLAVSLERLAPCAYLAVRNAAQMPAAYAADPSLLSEFYHGTSLQGAMGIMATEFKPGLGAGSDELNAFYGFPVPGVFVVPTFSLALTYPNHPTTEWATGRGRVNGGVVPSMQHSCPVRVVFRVLADQREQLWSKKDQKKKWNTQF